MKAKLISPGHGIEVGYENGAIADRYELLKQRIYIELGMNYFPSSVHSRAEGEKAVCRQTRHTALKFRCWDVWEGNRPYAPCRSKRISKYCFAISGWSCSNSDM